MKQDQRFLMLFAAFAMLLSLGCEGRAATPADTPRQAADDAGSSPDAASNAADDDASKHPFARRTPAPEFPKDATWLNTGGPLRLRDLKGKFVILDFWTYCCINCIHILPELKKLEHAYPNEVVVIGVHSAKFDTEKDADNIAEAILRYEIEHPVVNDPDHKIWDSMAVRSWPSLRVIDPEGNLVAGHSGELTFEQLDGFLKQVLPYYKKKGLLDESPVRFDLLAYSAKKTPLRFPGKVHADEAGSRLFITDSNNNRIVITSLSGELIDIVGNGAIGMKDGGYDEATFDHPQGTFLLGETLYVADTENHAIRKVDLAKKLVTTVSGTGEQRRSMWPGLEDVRLIEDLPKRFVGKPAGMALNSPWALWGHGDSLYIAMAGPHQIWKMTLDEKEIGPFAGNGREDIVDGPLLPRQPYQLGFSSFAQPSGLASDGEWLFVADSEGSSIRAVPFDPTRDVRTVIGTADRDFGRLFDFGDVDGPKDKAKLQHPIGVAYADGKLYVADTYNSKIKVVDAATGAVKTLPVSNASDEKKTFDEPAGVAVAGDTLFVADTNQHRIRTVDLNSGKVATLAIAGLTPPTPPQVSRKPSFPDAVKVDVPAAKVKAVDSSITLAVDLTLPLGWKINPLAPMSYYLEVDGEGAAVDATKLATSLSPVKPPATRFLAKVPVKGTGAATLRLSLNYYYCQDGGEGLCKVGSVSWRVPINVQVDGGDKPVSLEYEVKPD